MDRIETTTNGFGEIKYDGMTLSVIDLTPELAKHFLKRNIKNNRTIKKQNLAKIKSNIVEKIWNPMISMIILDENGNMVDGQHRCVGVIESNTPISILLLEGCPMSSLSSIDSGGIRTAADALKLAGATHVNELAAFIKARLNYQQFGLSNTLIFQGPQTNYDIVENWDRENDIEVIKIGRQLRDSMTAGSIAAYSLFYYITQEINPYFSSRFFSDFINLSNPMASLIIRRMVKMRDSKRTVRDIDTFKIMVQAWNSYIRGEVFKKIVLEDGKPIKMIGINLPMPKSVKVGDDLSGSQY